MQVVHEIHVSAEALVPARRSALARTLRRAGFAAASAMPARPIDTSLGVRTPPNAALSRNAPHAACAAKAPSTAASSFSCTISRASRACSVGWPGHIRLCVRAAMVSAASTPVWTLAFAMASDRLARRFETMIRALSFVRPRRRRRRPLSDLTRWGKSRGGATPSTSDLRTRSPIFRDRRSDTG